MTKKWDIESEEFYNLMQAYRHMPMTDQGLTIKAYEGVKAHISTFISQQRLSNPNLCQQITC